jgi:hypothetical protein
LKLGVSFFLNAVRGTTFLYLMVVSERNQHEEPAREEAWDWSKHLQIYKAKVSTYKIKGAPIESNHLTELSKKKKVIFLTVQRFFLVLNRPKAPTLNRMWSFCIKW